MTLREAFESKMMLLDGGMGSVIQTYGIKGANNDMLSIEKPEIILDIQRRYVDAGVDCLTTNTFSSQRVSQHEYHHSGTVQTAGRSWQTRLLYLRLPDERDSIHGHIQHVGPP